jgi:hypothetical protein
LRQGFVRAGIERSGAAGFDQLLKILMATASNPPDIGILGCARLSAGEGRLLQLFRLIQRDRLAEAAAVLGEWLPPAAVRSALGPAQAFAAAMSEAGLLVPLRHPDAASIAPRPATIHIAAGSDLVH